MKRYGLIKSGMLFALGFLLLRGASAQTVTESGGTAGNVPVFTSASQVKSSVITQSGSSIGIGTTSPNATLTIDGDGSTPFQLTIGAEGSSTGNYQLLIGDSSAGYAEIQTIEEGVGYNQALALQPTNGNVGIGTTAPAGQLSNNSTNYGDGGSGISATSFNWVQTATNGAWSTISSAGVNGLVVATDQTAGTVFQVSSGAFNASTIQRANDLFTVLGTGSVGIGTTRPQALLEVNGNEKIDGLITFPDNSQQQTAWTGVLCGGDYAESVDVSGDRKNYAAGDVLVIDPQAAGSFLKSAEPYSTAVTGIYATKPGVVGRRQKTDPKTSTTEVPMAMIGIVPTRVSAENGPIRPGDLLVTSATLGYAMKGTDRTRMLGAVIGKALGSLDSGTGMIEAVVTLQ